MKEIIMKTLQNNFTTPEQSKRLLKLDAPRWSADEYRDEKGYRHSLQGILDIELFFQNFPDCFPCWSVGRLIEIYITCIEHYTGDERLTFGKDTIRFGMIDCIIAAIEFACDDGDMDFSKLED